MIESVKALIRNAEGKYLILTLNDHPYFGNDIDLPGGELDEDESMIQAIIREIYEEVGLKFKDGDCWVCTSTRKYSRSGNLYNLMEVELKEPALVQLSWEHTNYEWLETNEVIRRGTQSKNGYLHLAADVLAGKV